jgi:hypothetical protein
MSSYTEKLKSKNNEHSFLVIAAALFSELLRVSAAVFPFGFVFIWTAIPLRKRS